MRVRCGNATAKKRKVGEGRARMAREEKICEPKSSLAHATTSEITSLIIFKSHFQGRRVDDDGGGGGGIHQFRDHIIKRVSSPPPPPPPNRHLVPFRLFRRRVLLLFFWGIWGGGCLGDSVPFRHADICANLFIHTRSL